MALKNVHFSVEKAKKEEGGVLAQLSSFFSMESAASSKNHVLSSFVAVFHVSIEQEKKGGKKLLHFLANDSEVVDLLVVGIQLV